MPRARTRSRYEIEFVLEEKLRDGAARAGIDFRFEHVDIGFDFALSGVFPDRRTDTSMSVMRLDARDEISAVS